MVALLPCFTLFPYTTLFRSDRPDAADRGVAIERSPVGVGAAEVERRALTAAQVEDIVRAEVAEREAAARDYEKAGRLDRKSTRLNSSHSSISYAVFCLKKKK